MSFNQESSGNKTKLSPIFYSKSSSCSSSSLLSLVNLLKLVLNDEQIILHWNQIIWHRSFWTDLMLGSQAKFWACAWPKMAVCLQSLLHTAILRLFQTFIFQRKLPNLLIELWEIFYHSYFVKQGLNFTRFGT